MSRLLLPTRAAALACMLVLASSAGVTSGTTAGPRAVDRTAVVDDIIPVIAPPIAFGLAILGTTTAAHDFVYTNGTASTQAVTVTLAWTNEGPNPGDFGVATDGCTGTPVGAGASCTVSSTFTPTAEYTRTATLRLDINGGSAETDVPLTGIGALPDSNVTWGPYRNVGSAETLTEGTGLARTVSGPTEYLHAIVERYDVARQGIYYHRSTNGGGKWSLNGVRVNPSTQIGARSAEAAAGAHVYVAWTSFATANPSGALPRPLWFRSNSDNGTGTNSPGSGGWGSVRRLTPSTSRIDYPKIAAAGANVYIAYTDTKTGVVYVKVSHDHGTTWTTVRLGTTDRTGWGGRIGAPNVAADGSTVAVAWIARAGGAVQFRSSANSGGSWTAAVTPAWGARPGTWPSIAVLGTRIAVASTGDRTMSLRIRTGSTWGPTTLAVRPSAGGPRAYAAPFIGQVALNGTTRVAIAAEWCWAGCAASSPPSAYRSDIVWRESATNGATWAKSQTVVPGGGEYDYAYLPSILWPSATTRYLMAAHWYPANEVDNVVFLPGHGTP